MATPRAALDDRALAARVAALSLEQKVRLLTGADFWSLHPEPAVGEVAVVVAHDVDPGSEIGVSFQLNLRPPHRRRRGDRPLAAEVTP